MTIDQATQIITLLGPILGPVVLVWFMLRGTPAPVNPMAGLVAQIEALEKSIHDLTTKVAVLEERISSLTSRGRNVD